jgi:hypothetical protein
MTTELDEELSYLRNALGKKKAEVSSARLATALMKSFKLGYNGNHSTYGSGMMRLHRASLAHESAAYDKVSELWYPPKEHTKHNRANLPGETIFYCASGNATSRTGLICFCPSRSRPSYTSALIISLTIAIIQAALAYHRLNLVLRAKNKGRHLLFVQR